MILSTCVWVIFTAIMIIVAIVETIVWVLCYAAALIVLAIVALIYYPFEVLYNKIKNARNK